MTTPNQPAKRFRLGSITLSIWANADRHGRRFYTTTLTRSYRNAEGKWCSIGNLHGYDLPVVRELAAQAQEWLFQQESRAVPSSDAVNSAALGDASRQR